MGCLRTAPPVQPQWMFLHATESGQKETEWLLPHSHCQSLPKLDSKIDVSAIQLVGYQTSSEETGDLYHQVYMLKRLPGSPPCGPEIPQEITRDIVSSVKDCLRQRRGKQSGGSGEPKPTSTHPS